MQITITQEFMDQCKARAVVYKSTYDRVMCEIFEHHLIETGTWEDVDGWAVDAKCEYLGHVDVKMLEPGVSPWWNIPTHKARNIFRQHGIIDNYVFVRADKKMSTLKVGDTINIDIIGSMTYSDVCKQIQTSRTHGFYVDTRRSKKITHLTTHKE